MALHDLGHTHDALTTGTPLRTDALDPEGRLDAIRALTPPLVDVGRGDEAWQLAASHPAPETLHAQLSELALVMTVAGDMTTAIARLQSLRAEVLAGPSHHDRLQVGIALGQAHFVRGTVGRARHTLREVMAGLDTTDARGIAPLVWSGLARAEAMSGDHDAARQAMRTAEDRDRGNPPTRFRADFATARAWVAAAAGDLAGAQHATLEPSRTASRTSASGCWPPRCWPAPRGRPRAPTGLGCVNGDGRSWTGARAWCRCRRPSRASPPDDPVECAAWWDMAHRAARSTGVEEVAGRRGRYVLGLIVSG